MDKDKNDVVIKVDNVKKYFKVYPDKGKTLKDRVLFHKRNQYELREVLKGISFEVKRGEAIGLIGKNGCGKSTTLKMLTRILRPNEGTITMKGRVSSLIELGAGFHPDLTGRENIYINASIFGIKAKEVDKRMDDIIRFSELEDFIDNPVRTYSSGMYMRLAFAVAINVDADILLIDEILAVGDVSFQTKCFEKLKEIKRKGTTIVIVSHAMAQIEQICDRCIWIEDGLIKEEGKARVINQHYLASMEEKRMERLEKEYFQELERRKREKDEAKKELEKRQEEERKEKERLAMLPEFCLKDATRTGNQKIHFVDAHLYNEEGKETPIFKTGEMICVELEYESMPEGIEQSVNYIIGITRDDGVYCFGTSALSGFAEDKIYSKENGKIVLYLTNNFMKGRYLLDIAIQDRQQNVFDYIYGALDFRVTDNDKRQVGIANTSRKWDVEGKIYEVKCY